MKNFGSIFLGLFTFILCACIYNAHHDYYASKSNLAYQVGYTDGYHLRREIKSDSLDKELSLRKHQSDSLYNLIKNLSK